MQCPFFLRKVPYDTVTQVTELSQRSVSSYFKNLLQDDRSSALVSLVGAIFIYLLA